jgi:hypothetical protein
MTTPKHDPARQSHRYGKGKATYRSPRLEILGSLRSGTRGAGSLPPFDGGSGMGMNTASDRRVKEEIVKISQHPLGLGIYRFRYKAPLAGIHGNGRRIGVMADEVAEKYPDAVSLDSAGYLRVDYGRLFH